MASCVDNMWTKELSSLDVYEDLLTDIKNVNPDNGYELPTELLKNV
jgi:membrane-bound lytic murein transglycosylase D